MANENIECVATMGNTMAGLKETKRGGQWVMKRDGKWQKDTWNMGDPETQSGRLLKNNQGWEYLGGRIIKTLCWCLCH